MSNFNLGSDNGQTIAYNPSLALRSLTDFNSIMNVILGKLGDAYSTLMDTVRDYWASPLAVDFYNKSIVFKKIIEEGKTEGNSLIRNAAEAVKTIAARNGGVFSFSGSISALVPEVAPVHEEMDGYYGIGTVKLEEAVSVFELKVQTALNELDAMKSNIAVRDNNGEIQSLYEERISKLKMQVREETTDIKNRIKSAIDDQNNQINAAIARATSRLEELDSTIKSNFSF